MGRWLEGGTQADCTLSTYRNWRHHNEEGSPDAQPPPFREKMGSKGRRKKDRLIDVNGQK